MFFPAKIAPPGSASKKIVHVAESLFIEVQVSKRALIVTAGQISEIARKIKYDENERDLQ